MAPPPVPDLLERLRNWASDTLDSSTAVALLVAHGNWLTRADFVAECVELFDGCDHLPKACLLWRRVPGFLSGPNVDDSPSMNAILALAVELAGFDIDTPLGELLSELDDRDTALFLDAIAHATGWPQRHHTHTVTGRLEGGA
jgi:hypothetical protein